MFYDRDGLPITAQEFEQRWNDIDYRIIAQSMIGSGGSMLSTVWLGVDYGLGLDGPPLIFETMLFDDDGEDVALHRWPTYAVAIARHDQLLAEIREISGVK